MIIPEHWAEARIQKRVHGRQITVRRFGWSDASKADAQEHAERRAKDAFDRIASGEPLQRREPRVRYNGADGVPIREEIIERFGDAIVSRNSYGARCLNTPNVFFADIDFDHLPTFNGLGSEAKLSILRSCFLPIVVGVATGWILRSASSGFLAMIGFLVLPAFLSWLVHRLRIWWAGGLQQFHLNHIEQFLAKRPDWHLRIYRTPNGLRLLAMHKTFDPRSAEVEDAFRELRVDRLFAFMCLKQNCFRARLTAKPWRTGIDTHLKPRPGVWPIRPERIPERERWVSVYERQAASFSACRFWKAIGAVHSIDPLARALCDYHDRTCRSFDEIDLA